MSVWWYGVWWCGSMVVWVYDGQYGCMMVSMGVWWSVWVYDGQYGYMVVSMGV